MTETLFTTDQVAARYGVCARTLERWRSDGCGPEYIRIGGQVRYRVAALDEWEKRQTFTRYADEPTKSKAA